MYRMTNLLTPDSVRNELTAIANQERRTWGQISAFLHAFEQSGHWKNDASSFTDWIARHARSLHAVESTLWRYLAVGRYYNKLRPQLLARHVVAPPLEELSSKFSPESFEILSKLERIAPYETFTDLADGLMQGRVTRAMLRSTWETFRPVLEGKTARGRGVPIPRFDPENPAQFQSMFESMVIRTLSQSNAVWLGGGEQDQVELFVHVGPLPAQAPLKSVEIDIVLMVSHSPSKEIYFSGVEVSGPFRKSTIPKLEAQAQYCDLMWIAVPEYLADYADIAPRYIGILTITGSSIKVIRHAMPHLNPLPQSARKTGDLAKLLLRRALKR